MEKEEKLALFLGMLCGDGCLSIKHNGEGYRVYPVSFFNTKKEVVVSFQELAKDLFDLDGKIYYRERENMLPIFEYTKHSRKVVEYLKSLGFPEGVKRDFLRVPKIIFDGEDKEKISFLQGLIMTDGSIKKNRGILIHMGSKLFLEDISELLLEFTGRLAKVKEFEQKNGKYKSYQLYLNKKEKDLILCPDGTMVLRSP